MLSLLIFLPIPAIVMILLLAKKQEEYYKYIAAFTVTAQLLLAVYLYVAYANGIIFSEQFNWVNLSLGAFGHLSVEYYLLLDGINVSMVLLSGIVLCVGVFASWNVKNHLKGYFTLYLLLSMTIFGCFLAWDLFLFFLFFEFMLLPMYFLIGIWGGERKEYASIKFILYTLFGSVFILIAIIALYFCVIDPVQTATLMGSEFSVDQIQALLNEGKIPQENLVHTFNLKYIFDANNYIPGSLLSRGSDALLFGVEARMLMFVFLLFGFLIKLPAVPFHTWLPDAHVEASTPVSVVLAGVLLKVGAYGLIRIAFGIFPDAAFDAAWYIGLIGVVSIIYGAMNAIAMVDFKKMIAYSSVSHMGFVLLGLASFTVEGMNGTIYQMFSHGILAALLFLIAGVLYDRTSTRLIENFRGLATKMPVYVSFVTIAFFASFGMPGFSGFIAELLILLGAFNAEAVNGAIPSWMAMVALLGVLLGAVYFLWAMQRMFFGKFWIKRGVSWNMSTFDLTQRELLMMLPLAVLAVVFGFFPSLLTEVIGSSVADLITKINPLP
jgi:NADH-quinone oxidoreductase subunit M